MSTGFSNMKITHDLLKSHHGGVTKAETSMSEWAEEEVKGEEAEENYLDR